MEPTRADAGPPEEARVLVLAPVGRDAPLARDVLAGADICAEPCPDMEALCLALSQGAGALLVAEEALFPAALQHLTAALREQPTWSDVPLVVVLHAGEITSGRLLTLRGSEPLRNVTYLERPVRVATLVSALRAALLARRRQYEVRDHLIERQRAEAELRAANQRKDQFLALLGHELRNPLAVISTSIHLLQRAQPPPEDRVARLYERIARQTRSLTRQVDDLLDISRAMAGKIALDRRPVEIAGLIRQALQDTGGLLRAQGHALRLSARPDLWVRGDAVRLEQVFVNLITNAAKYTPPGGEIDISVDAEEEAVVVRVRDSGVGIASEMLSQVFEPFSQAERTLDRSQGGLGIGLSLVRSLVSMHGGSVHAASDGLGRGSEFVVRLPRLAASPGRAPSAEGPRREAAGRRVLLIEDNGDIRESMRELLEEMGHRVEVAADGLEGVSRTLAMRPDVAVIDIGLPELDGYEVARRVRKGLGRDIRLIAMSGYGQEEDHRRSREAGFDAHLTKPATVDDLIALLSEGTAMR